MNITLIIAIVLVYFAGLLGLAFYTSRGADNNSFFTGNKKSSWWLVAFGMIGTSLSGVTFISVPGTVGRIGDTYPFAGFEYFQLVLGFFAGYFVVAFILLPLYYRLNLTSIYTYLNQRFNPEAHKTGAVFFIISRVIGATARLYLVIYVLQLFLLDQFHIPFYLTAGVILLMILLYTFEGGVKTIVITDTLQTSFMLISVVACIIFILSQLNISFSEAIDTLEDKTYLHVFNTNYLSGSYFWKQFIGGMFITISMTGLDQEMMQKNISVKNLKDSKKNMLSFATILLGVNFLFLFLGGLLYLYAIKNGGNYAQVTEMVGGKAEVKNLFNLYDPALHKTVNVMGDDLFPTMALHGFFPSLVGIIFIIGLVSALFPSADGALTSLTSSFCVDILNLPNKTKLDDAQKKRIRIMVHLIFTVIFMIFIIIFHKINNKSTVELIMKLAGYTYGPLLGLFSFGILTKRKLNVIPGAILLVCLLAPVLSYIINAICSETDYKIGVELIVINGLITFGLLYIVSLFSGKRGGKSIEQTH